MHRTISSYTPKAHARVAIFLNNIRIGDMLAKAVNKKQSTDLFVKIIGALLVVVTTSFFLSHVGIFVGGVLRSLNVLLVDQHFDALLDDGDGRGEARLALAEHFLDERVVL